MNEWESLNSNDVVTRRVPEKEWNRRFTVVSLVTALAIGGVMVVSFVLWNSPPSKNGVLRNVERLHRGMTESEVDRILGPTGHEQTPRFKHWSDTGGYVLVEFDGNGQVVKIEADAWNETFLDRVGRLLP